MFKLLRSRAKFFYWVIAISFVLFTFVVWGAQCNQRQSHGNTPQVLGKINGMKITLQDWDQAYRGYVAQLRKQYGDAELTANQRALAQETVWNMLLRAKLSEAEIDKRHLKPSADDIEKIIWNDPPAELRSQFVDSTGAFDAQAYRQALQNPQVNLDGLRQYLATSIPQQRLIEALSGDVTVTDQEIRDEYSRQHDRALAEYAGVLLTEVKVDSVPTDAEVAAYYAAHGDEFSEPEKVVVHLVSFPVAPSAADDREILQMAEDVRQDIVDGTLDFERAAALYSDDPGSKDKGGDLGTFDRNRMVPAFTEAAFSQKVGEVGPPVKTEYGYHIIEVLDRVEENGKVVKVHARHILFKLTPGADTIAAIEEKASDFHDQAVAQGFGAAAQADSLKVESPRPVREGRDIPGYPNTLAGAQFAFESKAGAISQVLKNDDFYYVLQNVETLPPGPAPLDDIKPQVVAKVTHARKLELAEQKLQPAVAAVGEGMTLAQAASKFGLTYAKTDTFTATGNVKGVGFNTDFNKAAFAATPGDLVPQVETPRGVFALRVLWRSPFDEADFAAKRDQIQQTLITQKRQKVVDDWFKAQLASAKITDNRAKLLGG